MKKLGRRKFSILVASFALSYMAVYFVLSFLGRYDGDAVVLDEIHGACLCASMDEYWQPLGMISATYGEEFLSNVPGYVFLPLIALDQKVWHPTKPIESRYMTEEEVRQWLQGQEKRRQERANQGR